MNRDGLTLVPSRRTAARSCAASSAGLPSRCLKKPDISARSCISSAPARSPDELIHGFRHLARSLHRQIMRDTLDPAQLNIGTVGYLHLRQARTLEQASVPPQLENRHSAGAQNFKTVPLSPDGAELLRLYASP